MTILPKQQQQPLFANAGLVRNPFRNCHPVVLVPGKAVVAWLRMMLRTVQKKTANPVDDRQGVTTEATVKKPLWQIVVKKKKTKHCSLPSLHPPNDHVDDGVPTGLRQTTVTRHSPTPRVTRRCPLLPPNKVVVTLHHH